MHAAHISHNIACRTQGFARLGIPVVRKWIRKKSSHSHSQPPLTYSRAVQNALHNNLPLVALESTIITHGMPYPQNLKTALSVENVIKSNGAVPATVAILNGKVHIGLEESELEFLASGTASAIKTSRRDIPYVLSQGKHGGTTVSGTMIAAQWAGIPIFVTGGIGGVHRGVESTMDVSADLTELGRTRVAVISAGVKSILDIGRTLEYLETEGVFVASFSKTKDFPSFFTAKSGHQAPYNVTNAKQAAQIIDCNLRHSLGSGMLFAVPIPEKFSAEGAAIEDAIQQALAMAHEQNISGKEVTPFILDKVNALTGGQSLIANIALVENNARIGAQIASELANLQNDGGQSNGNFPGGAEHLNGASNFTVQSSSGKKHSKRRPVVVGGINVDFSTRFSTDDVQSNGATFSGTIMTSLGGVGRNIADCLSRLGTKPLFISTMGKDSHAEMVVQTCTHMDLSLVTQCEDHSTATYCAVLKNSGELIYGIGDFRVHREMNKSLLEKHEETLAAAPVVIMDGNVTEDAMNYITEVCSHHQVPVWFEPTDINLVGKLFSSDSWRKLTYTSPNMNELRSLAAYLKGAPQVLHNKSEAEGPEEDTIFEAFELSKILIDHIPVVMVTMGKHGVLLCKQNDITGPLPRKGTLMKASGEMIARHYPSKLDGKEMLKIVSVSGAGDCIAAGVIMSALRQESPDWGMRVGLACAHRSLNSHKAVPETISPSLLSEGNEGRLAGRVVEFPNHKIVMSS